MSPRDALKPVGLSVVIPCYNEEKNIPTVLKNFARSFEGRSDLELVIVDNGSRDESARVIEEETRRHGYGFVRKVRVEKNQGYGFGILAGLKEAWGDLLAWTHADLQTDPADVLKAYRLYLNEAGKGAGVLVKGFRRNRALSERIFSFGMQTLASLTLGAPLSEINAQPKLFPRALYEAMKHPPHDFSLDLYLLYAARRLGYKIVTLDVDFKNRLYGEAKGGGGSDFKTRWKLLKRTWQYIFELKDRLRKEGV